MKLFCKPGIDIVNTLVGMYQYKYSMTEAENYGLENRKRNV